MNIIKINKFLSTFILFLCLSFPSLQAKEYDVTPTIRLGSPYGYPMNFDLSGNYLLDNQNKIVQLFNIRNSEIEDHWGQGTVAATTGYTNIFPFGINLRWFSVAENQFWEGQYLFDQKRLAEIMEHSIDNPFTNTKGIVKKTPRRFFLEVYVVPNGLVNLWIHTDHTKLWLGSFHAKKMQKEPNWNTFYQRALSKQYGYQVITRETFIKNRMTAAKYYIQKKYGSNDPDFLTTIQSKKPYTDKPWLQATKKYNWYFHMPNHFKVKYYRTFYANTEEWFTIGTNKEQASLKTLPIVFEFMLESQKTKQEMHTKLIIDFKKIQHAFEKINSRSSKSTPIELSYSIDDQKKTCMLYAIRNATKIKIDDIRCVLGNDNNN